MRLIDADKFILALMDGSLSSVDEDTILDLVDSVPIVDVAPVVHGRWIDDGSGIIICPECERGYNLHAKYTHYCPNCGAKMDGEKKDGGNNDALN